PGTGDKVRFAGNTSRSGCAWLLTDISYRRFLEQRMRGLEHISIAQKPEFMDRYVESMEFPDIRINNNQTI
ncbi:MAG TPA: ASKHA domain-containing protein, partial [Desulfohalobiaceae bacterium]|nr:ASKHA domain-containing protein [Desulfohalobiaceae bacterium]